MLPVLVVLTGLVYIFLIPEDPQLVKVLFKVIPMALIIFYAFLRLPERSFRTAFHRLMMTGIIVCILADAVIAYSFIAGLAIFLLGHVFYLAGFMLRTSGTRVKWFATVPIALYSYVLASQLLGALAGRGDTVMMGALLFYIVVISVMVLFAVLTGNLWVIMGSILFYFSDTLIAWNRFITDIEHSAVFIMSL
ncbi:hypothetical protein BBEV_0249 [Salisediminibacterium beveridgei]|uniref:YhhN-like protein n=1 Tax=Salisediminibacterium beveridgei TaxID=632773 RepID=A0A1D7QRM0_9BACI|nr:hypothetical protein BBEV_0249 [Salisediminibacterium beveridgei]